MNVGWTTELPLTVFVRSYSRSVGGASCPPQTGGCLLCGYNMVDLLHCPGKGCALVFSQLQLCMTHKSDQPDTQSRGGVF